MKKTQERPARAAGGGVSGARLMNLAVPVLSVLLAFLIGCVIMAALGANPLTALQSLWIGSFGSLRNVGTTLSRATPLIFTSLCACFAYRCGVFEGQIMGEYSGKNPPIEEISLAMAGK